MLRAHCRNTHPIVRLLLAVFLLLACLPVKSPVAQASNRAPVAVPPVERHPDRLLVGYHPSDDFDDVMRWLASDGLTLEHHWPELALTVVRPILTQTNAAERDQAVASLHARLNQSPRYRYVDYDAIVRIAADPNDPRYPEQWAIPAINGLETSQFTTGDSRIVIAVVDTGYAADHEDLDNSQRWVNQRELDGKSGVDDDGNGYVDDIYGWDWVASDNNPDDEHGHGTHVTGIISAVRDNGLGITGVGGNLLVAPLRVLDRFGSGYISDLVYALDYARQQGFPIINLSLTVNSNFPALYDAVKAVHADGILIFSATGNQGIGSVAWPAAYPETLAVAATNSSERRASFSNSGLPVDIAAPGDAILSTHLNSSYRVLSGTSMAVPHVAALAGLIWSLRPDFTREQVVQTILDTAKDIESEGRDLLTGAGQIDMATALHSITTALSLDVAENAGRFSLASGIFTALVHVSAPAPPSHPVTLSSSADGRLPVSGAVVNYSVTDPQGNPTGIGGSATSDDDGYARVEFFAPDTTGEFTVHAGLGMASTGFELRVYDAPITVTLSLDTQRVEAGATPVELRVDVIDPHDMVVGEDLTLLLTTSAGLLGNRSQRLVVNLGQTRTYTNTLIPGTRPATAGIAAAIGSAVATATLAIEAGPPVAFYTAPPPEDVIIVTDEQVALSYNVRDRYGNPVADGTTVALSASQGVLASDVLFTEDGYASTVLNLPDHWSTPILVRAQVVGTELILESTIMPHRLFIPGVTTR